MTRNYRHKTCDHSRAPHLKRSEDLFPFVGYPRARAHQQQELVKRHLAVLVDVDPRHHPLNVLPRDILALPKVDKYLAHDMVGQRVKKKEHRRCRIAGQKGREPSHPHAYVGAAHNFHLAFHSSSSSISPDESVSIASKIFRNPAICSALKLCCAIVYVGWRDLKVMGVDTPVTLHCFLLLASGFWDSS